MNVSWETTATDDEDLNMDTTHKCEHIQAADETVHLTPSLPRLASEILRLHKDYAELSSSVRRYEEEIGTLGEDKASLETRLEAFGAETEHLRGRLGDAETAGARHRTFIEDNDAGIAAMRVELNESQENLRTLRAKQRHTSATTALQVETMNSDHDAVARVACLTRNGYLSADTTFEDAETTLHSAVPSVQTNKGKSCQSGLKSLHEEMTCMINAFTACYTKQQSEMLVLQRCIDGLTDKLNANQTQSFNLATEIASLKNDLQASQIRNANLARANEALKADLNAADTKNSVLDIVNKSVGIDLQASQKHNSVLATRIESLKADFEASKMRNTNLNSDNESLKADLKASET